MRSRRANKWIMGVDEAGRGPLAGPVAVGGVWYRKKDELRLRRQFAGIRDSKKLSQKHREMFFRMIVAAGREGYLCYAIGYAPPETIDRRGIVPAIELAIGRMFKKINPPRRTQILLDGALRAPEEYKNQRTVVGGDSRIFAIQLASIVAKVRRDRLMKRADKRYPGYGFDKHKGYGTKGHYEALAKEGTCDFHRKTFVS